jgi:8-oxo-dGTP pyrophosphatase MutT (NUDIX family)
MAEVTPVPAASIILLRDDPLEVLMIRRHERSSFAPDVWAFPGGVLEESDRIAGRGILLNAMRIAAARELFEETGISLGSPLDLERLVWTSHWITPVAMPKRFDTYFFLARVGRDTVTTLQ